MSIPLNFGLWWSGAKLSYLRYLTFKTLRHFHPHSRIQLFTSKKFNKKGEAGIVDLEFLNNSIQIDYTLKLKSLGVEIIDANLFPKLFCHQQADIYRWIFLRDHRGGIYLDPDQIILQSFKSLPLDKHDFMYSSYMVNSVYAPSGRFSPIGVLGANDNSEIVKYVLSNILSYRQEGNYNALGVLMMDDVIKKIDMSKAFNAPSYYFYPAPICDYMNEVYHGNMKFGENNFSVHWYGGYSPSQDFNRRYTEEFAKTSNDSISVFLRESKII